jgi:hypothetical protein
MDVGSWEMEDGTSQDLDLKSFESQEGFKGLDQII